MAALPQQGLRWRPRNELQPKSCSAARLHQIHHSPIDFTPSGKGDEHGKLEQVGDTLTTLQCFSGGSRLRELLLVVLDHLLALCLRQVIRVTDWVYLAAAPDRADIF
jgi:hypothetical protein